MSNIQKYIPSDNNVICDICGKKRKRSECVMAYGTGIIPVVMSCIDGCADYDHPLNYPPPIIFDGRPVQDARPDISTSQIIEVPGATTSFFLWDNFHYGVWSAFNGLNNEFSTNPILTWSNFP